MGSNNDNHGIQQRQTSPFAFHQSVVQSGAEGSVVSAAPSGTIAMNVVGLRRTNPTREYCHKETKRGALADYTS